MDSPNLVSEDVTVRSKPPSSPSPSEEIDPATGKPFSRNARLEKLVERVAAQLDTMNERLSRMEEDNGSLRQAFEDSNRSVREDIRRLEDTISPDRDYLSQSGPLRMRPRDSDFSRRDTLAPQSPSFGAKYQPDSFLAANQQRASTLSAEQMAEHRSEMLDQEALGRNQKPLPSNGSAASPWSHNCNVAGI